MKKNEKFESMRPFIIEIAVFKRNTTVHYALNMQSNDTAEYEALCSDSKTGNYKSFTGDFKHIFKQPGIYKISFRGNLPSISIRDILDEHSHSAYHIINVCQWGDIPWQSMEGMFADCEHFNISANDRPDLSRVTSLAQMFKCARSMNAPLGNWDVSKVTDMNHMFYGAYQFNQPLEKWNVSKVTDMTNMFYFAGTFNQPLEKWDVSKVTDMNHMFYGAYQFNQPLKSWNVSKVTDMSFMFHWAKAFNQPLEEWNVSMVTNMEGMFEGTDALAKKPSWLREKA